MSEYTTTRTPPTKRWRMLARELAELADHFEGGDADAKVEATERVAELCGREAVAVGGWAVLDG